MGKAGAGPDRAHASTISDEGVSSADAIDHGYLARFTFGNAALEREVLQLFATQAEVYLDRLRTADSVRAWTDAAHTIKGSAAAIGARRLAAVADVAERLELGVATDEAEKLKAEALDVVESALRDVLRAIDHLAGDP